MASIDKANVTTLLKDISGGGEAPEKLLPLVYDELRRLAAGYMQNERSDHTLQPTALVHDAYIRLVDWQNVSWENRAHFFALAAQVMRKILIDHAVRRKAQKRDFGQRVDMTEMIHVESGGDIDMIDLHNALDQLAEADPIQARIVELRYFAGLSIQEAAYVLDLSPATVKRDWAIAKTWLFRRLKTPK